MASSKLKWLDWRHRENKVNPIRTRWGDFFTWPGFAKEELRTSQVWLQLFQITKCFSFIVQGLVHSECFLLLLFVSGVANLYSAENESKRIKFAFCFTTYISSLLFSFIAHECYLLLNSTIRQSHLNFCL